MLIRLLAGEGQELPSRVWLVIICICECGNETVQSSASEDIHNVFGVWHLVYCVFGIFELAKICLISAYGLV